MIKPLFESIHSPADNCLSIKVFEEEAFTAPYHYHPQYELTFINKGSGKRYVDNHIDQFDQGDLVLLGPNLPHCWKTDHCIKGEINASSIVVQFNKDFLGQDFFNKPELAEIRQLLERSQRGIIYSQPVAKEISGDLEKLVQEQVKFKKLHRFLEILYKLSVTRDFMLLNRLSYIPLQNRNDPERINKVFDYIMDNYKTNVSLDAVANLACMTPNAFCKYFKKVTQKTFIEVVMEYRLHYATSQLLHTGKSVAQICFDSGFNDIVYFTRLFKSKMQVSPLQYKKKFLHSLNMFDDSNYKEEFIQATGVA